MGLTFTLNIISIILNYSSDIPVMHSTMTHHQDIWIINVYRNNILSFQENIHSLFDMYIKHYNEQFACIKDLLTVNSKHLKGVFIISMINVLTSY